MTDLAGSFQLFQVREKIQFLHAFPYTAIHVVDQIHVDAVGVQTCHLFLKNSMHTFFVLCKPDRHFIGEKDFFAISIFQSFSQDLFALSIVVHERSIHVVYPTVDSIADDTDRFLFFHGIVAVYGESHASHAQQRSFFIDFFKSSVLHS